MQNFIGIIGSVNLKTSITLAPGTFIRPLTPDPATPLDLVEAKEDFQLRKVVADAWATRTYLAESFIDIGSSAHLKQSVGQIQHHLPDVLQDAWLVDRGESTYIGAIPPNTTIRLNPKTSQKKRSYPWQSIGKRREEFTRILVREGVLNYLLKEKQPKLIGWLEGSFLQMSLNKPVSAVDHTFVILYLDDSSS